MKSNSDPLASTSSFSPRSATRREFLRTSGAAAVGGMFAANLALPIRGAAAAGGDVLRVGLIGCGGRGTGAANQALTADKNVVLTAMGDVFAAPLKHSLTTLKQATPDRVKVDPDHCFVGLDAYQKVIDSGVDVVLLCSPPGFRPVHLAAAVAAGKHIFCEKPVATDAPGIRSVLASVAAAKQKKLALVAGFCWRYDLPRRDFFKRVHDGAIGEIRAIYGTYYTGPVKPMPPASERPAGMSELEWQLHNWYNFTWICGDSLVEQAVHSVDKMAWAMKDEMPIKAVAVGGRQIPAHGGNIFDHFEVNYEYQNGARGFLACRQQTGCYSENNDYLMGEKGLANIRSGRLEIKAGGTPWRYSGPTNDMYQAEHDELFAAIRAGRPINDGLWMTHSCLMAIMGRMAAYTGQEITWDQALNSQEKLVPDELDWNMSLEVPPTALPGRTKFV
ncbi:MAG: Gfo/Idh/MocA family oxidoreductase [Verrucomicrobia bacterium]|nr:Gfo/Idh/MocA family oxidoreductase [Verrucomicrobiota bacterium]